MGVYSNSRFINESFIDAPEPDLSYSGPNAANKIIAEMVANDTAFFDAIIVNDIHEACLVNAINEGASHLEPELYALQEATTGGIFVKIREFLMSIWKKISGLIMAFINKISGQVTTDNKKLVKKFEKQISSKSAALKNMSFKWSELKHSDWAYNKPIYDNNTYAGKDENEVLERLDNAVLINTDAYDVIDALAKATDNFIDVVESSKFEYDVYKEFIGDDAPESKSGLAEACHKYFFKDEVTKQGEFDKYESDIIDVLNNSSKTITTFNADKRNVDNWFKKNINFYTKLNNKFETKSKVNLGDFAIKSRTAPTKKTAATDINFDYNKEFDKTDSENKPRTYDIDGAKKGMNQVIAKAASTCKQYYSKLQICVVGLLDEKMAALQFHIKQCRRVWIQAASYSTNHESVLIDAIGEAADLETDQMLNAIN